MRPRNARRINRAIIAAALTALTLAGTGTARADAVDEYVANYAHIVCNVLANHPTVAGVEGIAMAIIDDGFTPESAGEIVGRSVIGLCPDYWLVVEAFADRHSTAGYLT